MNERQKRRLAAQISSALNSSDDRQLASAVPLICVSLLDSIPENAMPDHNNADFNSSCMGLASAAEKLLKDRTGTEEMNRLRVSLQTSLDAVQTKETELKRLNTEKKQADSRLQQLNSEVSDRTAEMQSLSDQSAELQSRLNIELSDLAILRKQQECNRLNADASSQEKKLQEAAGRAEEIRTQLQKTREEIAGLDAEIAAAPAENRRLYEAYQEKQKTLSSLQNAKTECSEEKQAELKKQIAALQPTVEKLSVDCDSLNERYRDLQKQRTDYDKVKHTLSTNLLEYTDKALNDLEARVKEQTVEITEVKQKADTLTQNLEKCNRLRRQYAAWLDADQTPLEAMIAAVPHEEAENLRCTMDPGQISEVRKLFDSMQADLNRLDQILAACTKAAETDRKALERRTHP